MIVACFNRSFNLWYLYIKLFEQLFIAAEPICDEQMNTSRNVQVVSYQTYFSFTFKRNNKYTSLKMKKTQLLQFSPESLTYATLLFRDVKGQQTPLAVPRNIFQVNFLEFNSIKPPQS